MDKLTDEQIEELRTRKTMILKVGYEDWAMSTEDAFLLLAVFTRAHKVEQVHTSNYRKSVWVIAEDQTPPFETAGLGQVAIPLEAREAADPFSQATKAVSG